MDVVFDSAAAEKVVARSLELVGRGDDLVTVVAIDSGADYIRGVLATATNANGPFQMDRSLTAREFAAMAMRVGADMPEIPRDWKARQPTTVYDAPALTGAAILVCMPADNTIVGVVALIGLQSAHAYGILREAVADGGFAFITSDAPTTGADV